MPTQRFVFWVEDKLMESKLWISLANRGPFRPLTLTLAAWLSNRYPRCLRCKIGLNKPNQEICDSCRTQPIVGRRHIVDERTD